MMVGKITKEDSKDPPFSEQNCEKVNLLGWVEETEKSTQKGKKCQPLKESPGYESCPLKQKKTRQKDRNLIFAQTKI